MKMLAIVKDNHKVIAITDDDIRDSVNMFINMNIQNYLDTLDDDDRLTIESLNSLYYSDCTLSTYTADKILKKLIDIKRKYEIKKVLYDAFEPYDVDDEITAYILKNPAFYDCFYTDSKGKVRVNSYILKDLFRLCFYKNGEQMLQALVDTVDSSDFSLEYYCHELRKYFSVRDFVVHIDKNNFETLLQELGEISNPKIDPSKRHACYNCANLSPLECEKAEYVKKPICDYYFIESGYQIFSRNKSGKWEMEVFHIDRCHDYSCVRSAPDTGSKSKGKK